MLVISASYSFSAASCSSDAKLSGRRAVQSLAVVVLWLYTLAVGEASVVRGL